MTYYVYILFSRALNKYYIGVSTDPERRTAYHNGGRGGNQRSYTKRSNDWKLEFIKEFPSKEQAIQFEKYIKTQKSRRFLDQLIGKK